MVYIYKTGETCISALINMINGDVMVMGGASPHLPRAHDMAITPVCQRWLWGYQNADESVTMVAAAAAVTSYLIWLMGAFPAIDVYKTIN